MIEENNVQASEFQQFAEEAVTAVAAAPKKKLRKLVKNQQVMSSPNDQNKSSIAGGEFNSGRKDHEGDKTIQPKPTMSYLDQVQELSAQIADMDAQRERQMASTYEENEQNEESEEKVYFDESEEALIARITGSQSDGSSKKIKKEKKKDKKKFVSEGDASTAAGIEGGEVTKEVKRKTKKQLVNLADIEKNEDMLKRLADKFDEAENEQEEVTEKGQQKDSEGGYSGETNIEKMQKKKQPKKESGAGMLQTKNKLFGEINAMEMNLDQIQEQPVEEECLNEQSMTFQRSQHRSAKHLISFLSHAVMYKKQRGLDFQTSQSQLKDAQHHQSQENDVSLGKGQSSEEIEKNQVTADTPAASAATVETQELAQENTNNNNDKNDDNKGEGNLIVLSQENKPSSQTENNKQSTINSQERKLQLMRQSSVKLQKLISMQSSSAGSSQQQQRYSQEMKGENSIGLAGITQVVQDDDQLDIELHVPSVDKSTRMNQLTNNTLFFNKVARGSQNDLFSTLSSNQDNNSNLFPLGKQTSKADSAISSNSKLDLQSNKSKDSIVGIGLDRKSSSSQSNVGQSLLKKKISREEYLLKGQQRITERKSQGLNLEEVQKRFKQTTLKSLGEKNATSEKEEKDRNKDGNDEDDDDEDDEDYEGEDKSDKSEKNGKDNGSDKEDEDDGDDDDAFEEKKRQLIEAEIQYKKLLALEDGVDEKEFEKQIREEYGLGDDNEEDEEENEDDEESENGKPEEDLFENSNHNEDNQMIEEMAEQQHNPTSQMADTDANAQTKPIKRLRNMASEIIRKEKEKEAAKKLRREKRERRRQLLNNPLMKKIMGDMIEDEAELGSDNEENDDKVKIVEGEDEHKQAGLAQGEDLDAELAELIDNVVEFDDENERAATAKFVRDLEKRDKQEIQKIIEGAYKGQRAQKRSLGGLLDEADGRTAAQNENKKLKRIQEAIQLLQENNEEHQYSDDDEEETNGGKQNKKHRRKHNKNDEDKFEDDEEEEIKLRAATLLLKKEYQKASDAATSQFNEHNLVDQSLLKMYNKNKPSESNVRGNNNNDNLNQNVNTMNSSNTGSNSITAQNANNMRLGKLSSELNFNPRTNELVKKVQPVKISSQLGMLKGNLTKNSVLDVKNNKSRLSQFNDSFNKDQLLNEFGESALAKAFSTHADHSQAIFYSKNNSSAFGNNMNNANTNNNNSNGFQGKEDSNSKTLENKANNNNNNGKPLSMKSQIPNLSKLFKASSSIAAGPSSNARMIFGRKREFLSEESKQ